MLTHQYKAVKRILVQKEFKHFKHHGELCRTQQQPRRLVVYLQSTSQRVRLRRVDGRASGRGSVYLAVCSFVLSGSLINQWRSRCSRVGQTQPVARRQTLFLLWVKFQTSMCSAKAVSVGLRDRGKTF